MTYPSYFRAIDRPVQFASISEQELQSEIKAAKEEDLFNSRLASRSAARRSER